MIPDAEAQHGANERQKPIPRWRIEFAEWILDQECFNRLRTGASITVLIMLRVMDFHHGGA